MTGLFAAERAVAIDPTAAAFASAGWTGEAKSTKLKLPMAMASNFIIDLLGA
jgi:uncharacterized membrane protein